MKKFFILLLGTCFFSLCSCASFRTAEPIFFKEEVVRVYATSSDVKYIYTDRGRVIKTSPKESLIFAERGDTIIYDVANECAVDIILR